MKIEIYEYLNNRIECRSYEIEDGLDRVLLTKMEHNYKEVWGFDKAGKQVEAKLISVDQNVIILG